MIKAKDVSVRYITGDFREIGLKEYILRHIYKDYHVQEFWAVQDVSFSVGRGEMLGIIGTNGAGKSTLLKVISGIMEPMRGTMQVNGRVTALLELGSGFDSELTVRENTYLRGALLGYTRAYIDEKYDEIIDFSELSEYQNRPFKHLSTGMKARLAFSIASMVQPEILILDEVLSVGDGGFRVKSQGKMKEIIGGGATTLLVSHSTEMVQSMCDKVLWLNRGRQVDFGDPAEICDRYRKFLRKEIKI